MAERERLDATASPSSSLNSPQSDTYHKPCQYLTVDETKRPRANSDPVGLHFAIANLPQITVTGDDGQESDSKEDNEVDSLLGPPAQRPRANTCPDDMFRLRRGRPPTPPPADVMKSPAGKKKFLFNFNTKDLNGISFTHHRLCKVSEDGGELVTKSNQNIRPSRRASCLAALSETTVSIGEQKEEEEEEEDNDEKVPKLQLILPGKSGPSETAAKPIPQQQQQQQHQQQQQQQTLEKNFQRIDINPAKSNLRSEGVDLGMSMASPNIVTF